MSKLLLVGTENSGLYRANADQHSVANLSWHPCSTGLVGNALSLLHLSFSNVHGNRAYIATKEYIKEGGNVYRCDDVADSDTWHHLTLPAPTGHTWTDPNLYAVAICTCTEFPNVVHVLVNNHSGAPGGTYAWVYRSTDAGQTWYYWQWSTAGALGRNLNVLQSNSDSAHFAGAEIARVRIRLLSAVRTGTPPFVTTLYDGAIAIVWALTSPGVTAYYWQYGQGGGCRQTTCMFTGIDSYIHGVCGFVVESPDRARAVTHRTGAGQGYFRGTNDGANQAFARNTPEQCNAVYGVGGWYFVGRNANGTAGSGWHTIWATNDDGVTFSGVAGASPQNNADGLSIPSNCGGVSHIVIACLTPSGGSTPGGACPAPAPTVITPITRHQSRQFSIEVYQPSIASITPRGRYIGSLSDEIKSYEHELAAWLGYVRADITLKTPIHQAEEWIAEGLLRHIEVYGPELTQIFEGFVNQIDAAVGPLTVTRGPLLDTANRAHVRYAEIIDDTTDPPAVAQGEVTTIANDTAAQALYGIIQKVLTGGTLTTTNADQLRDTYLAETSLPETTKELALSGGSEVSVTLHVRGWADWLRAYIYNNAAAAAITISAKIADVLDADPNSLFASTNASIATNALLSPDSESNDRFALDIIQGLVAIGDGSSNRYLFQVGNDRHVTYVAVPTTVEYHQRFRDPAQRVTTPGGDWVMPWRVEPGKWLLLTDFLIGRTIPTTLREDPRALFIERLTFRAPWDLRISGGKVGSLAQMMARMGLGGTAA